MAGEVITNPALTVRIETCNRHNFLFKELENTFIYILKQIKKYFAAK
jgi:hypothetical protein